MVNMSTSLYCQHCQHFGVFSTFARKIFPFPQGSQLTFMRKWRYFVIHGAPSWPSWAPRRSAWSPADNEKSSLPHDFPKTWGSEDFFCHPRVAQLTFLRKMKIFRCPRGPSDLIEEVKIFRYPQGHTNVLSASGKLSWKGLFGQELAQCVGKY